MTTGQINVAMTPVEELLHVVFSDKSILYEAFLAPGCGVVRAGERRTPDGNKRLALLGDTVLRLAVIEREYEDGAPRGVIDASVQHVANNRNLERRGIELKLDRFVTGNPSQKGVVNSRVLTDTVEAIVGAAYLDGGMSKARAVIAALGLE